MDDRLTCVRKYGSNLKKYRKVMLMKLIEKMKEKKRKSTLGEKCKMSKSKEGLLVVVLRRGAGCRGDAVRWLPAASEPDRGA